MPLIERHATPKPTPNTLSRDSEVYKKIYDLLEEHTHPWITDSWEQHPGIDVIKVTKLVHTSLKRMLELADKHGFDRESAVASYKNSRHDVLLHVNDASIVVTQSVADQIIAALNLHGI